VHQAGRQRHGREGYARGQRRDAIDDERRLGEHDVLLGRAESAHHEVEQLVRAGAEQDLFHRDAVLFGQLHAQVVGSAVGVAVRVGQRAPRGLERARARPERVLVRSQLQPRP